MEVLDWLPGSATKLPSSSGQLRGANETVARGWLWATLHRYKASLPLMWNESSGSGMTCWRTHSKWMVGPGFHPRSAWLQRKRTPFFSKKLIIAKELWFYASQVYKVQLFSALMNITFQVQNIKRIYSVLYFIPYSFYTFNMDIGGVKKLGWHMGTEGQDYGSPAKKERMGKIRKTCLETITSWPSCISRAQTGSPNSDRKG